MEPNWNPPQLQTSQQQVPHQVSQQILPGMPMFNVPGMALQQHVQHMQQVQQMQVQHLQQMQQMQVQHMHMQQIQQMQVQHMHMQQMHQMQQVSMGPFTIPSMLQPLGRPSQHTITYERVTVSLPTQAPSPPSPPSPPQARASIVELNDSVEMEDVEEEIINSDESVGVAKDVDDKEGEATDAGADVAKDVDDKEGEATDAGADVAKDVDDQEDEAKDADGKVGEAKKTKSKKQRSKPYDRKSVRRSKRNVASTQASTSNTMTPEERILLELESVPNRMRASSKFQEEHLRKEAEDILKFLDGVEAKEYLKKIAENEDNDETEDIGSGLGPFNLFKDLQTQLLDFIEAQFGFVAPHKKYHILLPAAIVYALQRIHRLHKADAIQTFEQYTTIVEPFVQGSPTS